MLWVCGLRGSKGCGGHEAGVTDRSAYSVWGLGVGLHFAPAVGSRKEPQFLTSPAPEPSGGAMGTEMLSAPETPPHGRQDQ